MTTTITQTFSPTLTVTGDTPKTLSPELPLDLSKYPKLSPQQVGHLRHFYNLAFQQDGEWRHMGVLEPGQEFLDAYRYQLANMSYAAAVAHYHRLPALRTIFKPLIRQLIHKMLRRDVWGYWFNTSHGGILTDPSLTELRKPWPDPVVKENIMYSGHLLLMTSLYGMLFDDDEFEKDDSIVFRWDPIFWGFGLEEFKYSNRTLQKAILDEMERNNWVGVCCEPNVVFIVCNQFPLIAMRYNDVRDGTNAMDEILPKYQAAWTKKRGMVGDSNLFNDWWMVKQDFVVPARDLAFTAWGGAFLHSWNPSVVESLYEKQAFGFITHSATGETNLQPPIVANHVRTISAQEPALPEAELLRKAVSKAKEEIAASGKQPFPYTKPSFGYVTQWLSELGKKSELDGLLAYADAHLNPEWEDGGLYYRRNDKAFEFSDNDEDAVKWTFMSPYTGNTALGYARLNVPDGQRIMYEKPWTTAHIQTTPYIDNLHFVGEKKGVSVLRGQWDPEASALILTVRGWDYVGKGCEEQVTINPAARNLKPGRWALYVQGKLVVARDISKKDDGFEAAVSVRRGEEVDVVFLKA